LAVSILSIPQLGTQAVANALEWLFMILLPNFCLGQGVSDFYSNYIYLNNCKPIFPFCDYFCLNVTNFPCCKGTVVYYVFLLTLLLTYLRVMVYLDTHNTS